MSSFWEDIAVSAAKAIGNAFGSSRSSGGASGGASRSGSTSSRGLLSYEQQGKSKYKAKGPSDAQQFGYRSGGGGQAGSGGRALKAVTRSDLHPVTGQLLAAFLRAQASASANTRKGSDVT